MDWEKIFDYMGHLISGSAVIAGIKLLSDLSNKKKKAKSQRDKKLEINTSFLNHVVWLDDNCSPPSRPLGLRLSITNPKEYEVRVHTIKLLSNYRELELISLPREITIFPGPSNVKKQNLDSKILKSDQKYNNLIVRLIDHEDQFHDSSPINLN